VTNTTGSAYRLNATVHDTDGDGRATLLLRTADAGGDDPTLFVREGDETRPAEITGETTPDRTLPPALYSVSASVPDERNAWDTGTLVVYESSRSPANGTTSPETPDPLEVQTTSPNTGLDLLPLGSIGVGGLIAIGGLTRLLRR
jgi:hypothetical protein